MTATPNFAADAHGVGAGDAAVPAQAAGPFVLNLCSSTTPMALAQTDLPELKRFNFFVSRRFEEGRERFRLHMGYFSTLAEAEEWLAIVREIYPGAWAGEAPGRKLRERAAAAQAAQAQHAAGPQPQRVPVTSAPPPPAAPVVAPPAPAPAVQARKPDLSPLDAALSMRVPVLKAAPESPLPELIDLPRTAARAAEPPKAAPPKPAPPKAAATPPASAAPARAAAPKPAPAKVPPVKPAAAKPAPAPQPPPAPAKAAAPKPAPAKPAAAKPAPPPAPAAKVAAPAPKPAPAKPAAAIATAAAMPAAAVAARAELPAPDATARTRGVFGDSNVREVLQALGDASATGETRLMRAPVMAAEPVPVPAPAPALAPAPGLETPPPAKNSLTDTQVLKLLETRGPEGEESAVAAGQSSIPMLKPDDTGTREALKEAVTADAPVLFAVQLQWSVQPVELDKVPPLAIFSAYTLYTVEGSRDGRKWFGLRLGFFSDAISAKQVAHYVRSEFTSVAVVPVSQQEKSRATDQDKQAASVAAPAPARPKTTEEFKLIDDDTAQTEVAKLRANLTPSAGTDRKAAGDAAARKIPGRPIPKVAVGRTVNPSAGPAAPAAKARAPGKVGAREKRGAQSLEETLEILGAGQLQIDDGRSATINDSGVRHLRVEVQKNSPFSKLLERLSERMKKP
ncbi:MAG: hypothetical protein JSS29_15800 [Proteobacteria bacterium]|nr:hypothetical protein [Pseudomonadota bacterium]